ncbi:MAG TPA: adenylate/guanylate cyclase domain-containing protein [Chitinophagaceae bacterium]|nr:adenylate/guanylate cyclase domain-containing protein [Chitinophagaceae bacterium]HEX5654215.1 adenylate/guanylate cyclase domain-containing protein [Chitinophagaceae bacterium]
MRSAEEKAMRAFHDMWDFWKETGNFQMDKYLNYYSNEFKGFGSGMSEVWRGREDMRKYSEGMLKNDFKGFLVDTKWIEAYEISPGLVCLWGEIIISVPLSAKTITLDPVRVTALFKDGGQKMEIVQWHVSEPDLSSEHELWPGTGEPKRYEEVSVLFTDFVGFSNAVATIPAKKLVNDLNEIFAAFDRIIATNGLEKIKTIGDSYMAAGGIKEQAVHPAIAAVTAARQMMEYLAKRNESAALKWEMRAGIHCGPLVGGAVGADKLSFDLWGDTVNLASRMESCSVANKINVSAYTYELIRDVYPCEYRGKIETKDRGKLEMYFVL